MSDTLLFYTKSPKFTWNSPYQPHSEKHLEAKYRAVDEDGRRYTLSDMTSPNPRANLTYEWQGRTPPANGWRYSRETMAKLDAEGRIWYPEDKAKRPRLKRFLDEMQGTLIGNVWTDIDPINSRAAERLGYPTQKPLALLERIIKASSNEGDIVMDCYCGCGTTVTAAHALRRRWVGIDITAVSVGIIKSRLEQSFEDLKGKVAVEGFPKDFESARSLFEADPYLFQAWACTLIDAYPLKKKGADSGIDGWLNFFDLDDTPHRAVVQVKGGKVQVGLIRDFAHVVVREKASLGFFLCMGDVTEPMRKEALKEGYWTSAGGKTYPKLQILTVADLLSHTEFARLPPQDKRSMLGFKAKKQNVAGQQADLFEED